MREPCVNPVPNYSTTYTLIPTPSRPPPCTMATFERAVDDAPNVGSHSATAAVLNADIETLTAVKDTIQATPIRTVLESVIVILTPIKVKFLLLFPFPRLFISYATRTRR